MKKELRDKERELFKKSMELRKLDYSKIKYDRAVEIREQQDQTWKKAQYYKNLLEEIGKIESKSKSR